MKRILSMLSILLLLCACTNGSDIKYPYSVNATSVDMSSYPGILSTKHNFKQIKAIELYNTIDKQSSGLFYVGTSSCNCCQKVTKYVNEVAQELDVTIYYLDVYNPEEDLSEKEKLTELMSYLDPVLGKNENGEKVVFTPHLISIINGEFSTSQICYDDLGISDINDEKSVEKLKDVYRKIMKPFADK